MHLIIRITLVPDARIFELFAINSYSAVVRMLKNGGEYPRRNTLSRNSFSRFSVGDKSDSS